MIEEIIRRRSIRKYIDKPVEEEKILNLLDSARLAPSGSNTQPWHFIIVRSKANREKLVKISNNQKWMLSAPVFIQRNLDTRDFSHAEEKFPVF